MIASSGQGPRVKFSCLAFHLRVYFKGYQTDYVRFHGRKVYFGRLATTIALIDEIWRNGAYNPAVKESPLVVLDVGANIGVSVLWWHNLFPVAHIIAIEPDPDSVRILRRNVNSWGFYDQVEVLDCAAAPANGPVLLYSDDESLGETTNSTVFLGQDSGAIRTTTCTGVTLSELIRRCQPQLVKIDVEGGE